MDTMNSPDAARKVPPTELPIRNVVKIQDISTGKELAPHIQHLMTLKGEQDFVSVHEWSARLCHALMIEAGFFPVAEDVQFDNISPLDFITMPDELRIAEFVPKLSPNSMFSAQGIYALKYKAIQTFEVEVENSHPEISEGDGKDVQQLPESIKEWKYKFSGEISVTMFFTQDRLTLTAVYHSNPDENTSRPLTHQFTINIEEFFLQRARMVPVELRPSQWIRKFDLNYSRFSGYVKSKFAMYLLDKMDAVVFERRGIISLPHLVMLKILKKSRIQTILNMGKTCTYLFDITRDNHLWKFLLKRDFPFDMLTSSPSASADKDKDNDEPEYYDIYKQKYLSKYRRVHRMQSYPLSFPIRFGPGRRNPSMPLQFDRFDR